jgi:hypothetical protein
LEIELFAFPNARHDDQVDGISHALAYKLSGYGWNQKSDDGFARVNRGVGPHSGAAAANFGNVARSPFTVPTTVTIYY